MLVAAGVDLCFTRPVFTQTDPQFCLRRFFPQRVITTDVRKAFSVFAADLDGDGDLDVLSASQHDDKIAWYENEADCNGNGVNDGCDVPLDMVPDCNGNIRPDDCDMARALSLDCNFDGVPDECCQPLAPIFVAPSHRLEPPRLFGCIGSPLVQTCPAVVGGSYRSLAVKP